MAGKPGIRNLIGMRGRIKGGQSAPITVSLTPDRLAGCSSAFLTELATRAYLTQSINSHRWALKGFVDWAEDRGHFSPTCFTRARIEEFQHHLHHYRSPRGGRALVINTQLVRLGCVRRFFGWLCRSGVLPANPAADLDLPRKQSRQLPKSLSVEEIDRILSIPNPADPFGLRDRTILELFYATGIRPTEMSNLDHGDYDPVKHPHLLLPKLFQPRRLLRIEFPFPLQRRCRGIVFTILLRSLALIVVGRCSGGFLAFGQQSGDDDFSKMVLSKSLVLDYRDRPCRRCRKRSWRRVLKSYCSATKGKSF
jgi:hypothetical protein